jgi:hypothetical protein
MTHSDIPVANADALALLQRLQHHPSLINHLEALLGIVENTDGNAFTADEAEELVAQELRRLGHDALQDWAVGRQAGIEARHAARPHYHRKEKKSYGGRRALGFSASTNKSGATRATGVRCGLCNGRWESLAGAVR